jgi:DNA-binding FrmR family transcriptional regulator
VTRTDPTTPDAHACGCAPKIGPGALAAGVDPVLKDANLKHLRRIEGQVHGIAAMVESDRYCADIITQIAAARASLQSVARNLLRNHLMHCADRAFREQGPTRDEMIEELLNLTGMIGR